MNGKLSLIGRQDMLNFCWLAQTGREATEEVVLSGDSNPQRNWSNNNSHEQRIGIKNRQKFFKCRDYQCRRLVGVDFF